MPLVTHFAWRFASSVFLSGVSMEWGCHTQDEKRNLEAAGCMLQRILYRAVEAMSRVFSVTTVVCQGHLALPSTLPRFPRTGFFVSLRDTSQSSPSPYRLFSSSTRFPCASGSASTFSSSFSTVPSHYNPNPTACMPGTL